MFSGSRPFFLIVLGVVGIALCPTSFAVADPTNQGRWTKPTPNSPVAGILHFHTCCFLLPFAPHFGLFGGQNCWPSPIERRLLNSKQIAPKP